jgi:alginate O-acetyltransferase complex protein AlgI
MPFNSSEFLVFYLIVFAAGWLVVGFPRLRIWLLLLASYYFYASNNGWIIGLLLISTQIDYTAGLAIEAAQEQRTKRRWLVLSLVTNLGLLGFFKYANFFAGAAFDAASAMGIPVAWETLDIVLPVGISFYTFQSMSYTIDVYHGRMKAERSWSQFAFYVAYFPQLVAGPIVRARHFIHQMYEPPRLTPQALEGGLQLIFKGLFKKLILADTLAIYVDHAFGNAGTIGSVEAWIGLYAFAFQIYFDFSGYSDVAIGCARLMGFRLPPNFRRPYAAVSVTEFWRRWHLSLSYWLRDYLYKPLGGNRMASKLGVYRNLMITMLLGGLWHGAAWTFILWGGLHGIMLVIERALGWGRLVRDYRARPVTRVAWAFVMFNFFAFTWLPFRAEGWSNMTDFIQALGRTGGEQTLSTGLALSAAIIAAGWVYMVIADMVPLRRYALRLPVPINATAYALGVLAMVVFTSRGTTTFIYFAF